MKRPNQMVQMDILGPFYLSNSSTKNYIISCIDDCTRKKAASRWTERKRSKDVLEVLEEWTRTNGKPKKVMHDNTTESSLCQNRIVQAVPERERHQGQAHTCCCISTAAGQG